MAQKYVIKSSNVKNVNHTSAPSPQKPFKAVAHHKRIHAETLEDRLIGQTPVKGITVKRSTGSPVMRQFMESIQKSKLDSYNIVSTNLALESKKSMERLKAMIGEVGTSGEQTPSSRSRS